MNKLTKVETLYVPVKIKFILHKIWDASFLFGLYLLENRVIRPNIIIIENSFILFSVCCVGGFILFMFGIVYLLRLITFWDWDEEFKLQ